MARAKRTDRTDARRRYRAEQAGDVAVEQAGDELVHGTVPAASSQPRRKGTSPSAGTQTASAPARPVRPSFSASARAAYRSPNLREDLGYLPRLLIHWSVLVSAALAVVGTAVFVAAGTQATDAGTTTTSVGYFASMLVSLFVGPPPFGAALLIGFMLQRATYLVGFVIGLLASACFSVIVISQASAVADASTIPLMLLQVWILGPIGTMFFAAAIAWYRRFLDLLNPNRAARAKATQKTQQQGRGNAPRNRLSGGKG